MVLTPHLSRYPRYTEKIKEIAEWTKLTEEEINELSTDNSSLEEKSNTIAVLTQLTEELKNVSREALSNYSETTDYNTVLKDAADILEAFTEKDAKDALDFCKKTADSIRSIDPTLSSLSGKQLDALAWFDQGTEWNYDNVVVNALDVVLTPQLTAIEKKGFPKTDIHKLMGSKMQQFFPLEANNIRKQQQLEKYAENHARDSVDSVKIGENYPLAAYFNTPGYVPIYQGPASNLLATISTNRGKIDKVTKTKTIIKSNVTLTIDGTEKALKGMRTSTRKLLDKMASQFAINNHYKLSENAPLNTLVSISIKDYAKECNRPVNEAVKETPEEQEKEKKRAKQCLDNFRRELNDDLDTLYHFSLNWTENQGGGRSSKEYANIRIISSKGVNKNGYAYIRFSEDWARYLNHAYVAPYPTALFSISNTKQNAYCIGRALALHFSNDNNQIRGTATKLNILSVLSAAPDIISYDEMKKTQNRNWKERIMKPLEAALEELVDTEIISEWYYSKAKGSLLTDEELNDMDYTSFSSLYITFAMPNAPDQKERRARRIDEARKKVNRKKNENKTEKS